MSHQGKGSVGEKAVHYSSTSKEEDWLAIKSIASRLLINAVTEKMRWKNQVKTLASIIALCESEQKTISKKIHQVDYQLYERAFDLVCAHQNASISWLHQELQIDYGTTAELIAALEEENIIGAPNHVGHREVLRDERGMPL